ncbi:MAG: O-antigen ligase family protein [Clostridia bacterium]|nr:O-antigen ligase family protein [Clostridia bacterium]
MAEALAATTEETKEKISIDCLFACMYFICLPLTVVTTPFGSVLKLVTMPTVAFLSARMLMGKSKISFNYVHFTYFLYVLYTILQLSGYYVDRSVTTTRDMVLGFLTFMLISMRVYNEREIRLIEWIWLGVGAICIYVAFSSKEVVSEIEERAVIRVFGCEEDQNQFCSYFIMPFLICIKRITKKEKLMPLYAVMLLLMMYAILKTGSRGGLLGILIGAFAYIIIGIKSVKAKVAICLATVVLSVLVITVVFPLLPETVRERYSIEQVAEDKGSGRFDIWEYLLEYTFAKPERIIFGSGVLSSYKILSEAPKTFLNGVAHNTFIQIFSDQGLLGLLLFLLAMFACLIRPMRTDKLYTCAFIALMAFGMSLTFYVFKPYLNIMMMCAISVKGHLPEDVLEKYNEEKRAAK